MMRPRNAAPAIVLVLLSLLALQNSPISHSGGAAASSSIVSIHLVGLVTGWNGTDPKLANPTITVNQGDIVHIILTGGDTIHQFALDLDNDTAMFPGRCPTGDACASTIVPAQVTTFNFTASFAPGRYAYFCTFHPTMVGTLIVLAAPAAVAIASVSPNPAC